MTHGPFSCAMDQGSWTKDHGTKDHGPRIMDQGSWTKDHGPLENSVLTHVSMKAATSKPVELQERFISFAVTIIALSGKLPRTTQGRHIARQVLRSGTATAANYGEARGAESRSDFVHKLGVVLKELNETGIWLELIVRSSLLPSDELDVVIAENRELSRIMTASIKTARGSIDR